MRYTFRQRYLRSCLAFDLWKSGLTLREIGKRLGVSVERARQLAIMYPKFTHRISPISHPYLTKERYGDNSAYVFKSERNTAMKRQLYFGWERPENWEVLMSDAPLTEEQIAYAEAWQEAHRPEPVPVAANDDSEPDTWQRHIIETFG